MKITRVYPNTDLRCSFDGLREIAKKSETDASTLVFINTARTAFKMLTGEYLVYYRNGTKRIPFEAIRHLPEHFGGSPAQMDSAIRKSLEEKLAYKHREVLALAKEK